MVDEPSKPLDNVKDLLATARAIMAESGPKSRDGAVVITKIDEAEMWRERCERAEVSNG